MQERYKDTDLREALKRKYANTPLLSADFMANMEKRLENHGDRSRDSKKNHGPVPMIRWVAVAASLLILVGVGLTIIPTTENQTAPDALIAQQTEKAPQAEMPTTSSEESISPKPADSQSEAGGLTVRSQRTEPQQPDVHQQEVAPAEESSALDIDSNLHYASNETKTDTLPYQNPARMDEFITKMADYHQVKEGELKCSAQNDSNIVSAVYVFPDRKEIDLFNRLLQAACWYSDETPGYLLSFSHQQFFFELKDTRQQLHYRWIAERVNGKILLYCTYAPLGTKESSTCYQEYRDELMHIKSINNKTKKI